MLEFICFLVLLEKKKTFKKKIENLDPPCVSKIHLIKCKWFRLGPDSAPSSEATVLDVE